MKLPIILCHRLFIEKRTSLSNKIKKGEGVSLLLDLFKSIRVEAAASFIGKRSLNSKSSN